MTYWAEGFKKAYPNVNIQIEGKGSSTAPPALTEGTSQLGPMSREMTGAEKDKFEAKYGYKPTQVRVALDGLAVYVNKDNPIKQLTFKQVDGDLLLDPQARRQGHQDLGRPRPDGRVGGQADLALRPQLGVRHVRLLQGARAREGRLQEQREGAAGLVVRRPGRRRGQVRDRLLGRRLHDLRRQDRPARRERRRPVLRRVVRERPLPQVPALALPLRLRQPGPEQAARPAHQGVLRVRPLEGRPGDRRQGRLLPADVRPSAKRSESWRSRPSPSNGHDAAHLLPAVLDEGRATASRAVTISGRRAAHDREPRPHLSPHRLGDDSPLRPAEGRRCTAPLPLPSAPLARRARTNTATTLALPRCPDGIDPRRRSHGRQRRQGAAGARPRGPAPSPPRRARSRATSRLGLSDGSRHRRDAGVAVLLRGRARKRRPRDQRSAPRSRSTRRDARSRGRVRARRSRRRGRRRRPPPRTSSSSASPPPRPRDVFAKDLSALLGGETVTALVVPRQRELLCVGHGLGKDPDISARGSEGARRARDDGRERRLGRRSRLSRRSSAAQTLVAGDAQGPRHGPPARPRRSPTPRRERLAPVKTFDGRTRRPITAIAGLGPRQDVRDRRREGRPRRRTSGRTRARSCARPWTAPSRRSTSRRRRTASSR